MATFVGTQANFEDGIISLLELEYDAVGAYELALERLTSLDYKAKLSEFVADHRQHISFLKEFYAKSGLNLPQAPDLVKGMMAKMKVVIGDLIGADNNILRAMLDNELDTNTAYERMSAHPGQPIGLSEFFINALQDERRHKAWFEQSLATLSGG